MPITERFEIVGMSGQRLAAKIDRPDAEPAAWALLAHGWTGSMEQIAVSRIGRFLSERGVAAVRFDMTGLGDSEGEFSETNFSTMVMDIVSAADAMRRFLRPPGLLFGHSLGGAAMIAAASKIPESAGLAVLGAPSEPSRLLRHLDVDAIERDGQAEAVIMGRPFLFKRHFVRDLRERSLREELGRLEKSFVVLHSPEDEIVPFTHAEKLLDWARAPKSLISVSGADHLLTKREDAEFVSGVLAAWILRLQFK